MESHHFVNSENLMFMRTAKNRHAMRINIKLNGSQISHERKKHRRSVLFGAKLLSVQSFSVSSSFRAHLNVRLPSLKSKSRSSTATSTKMKRVFFLSRQIFVVKLSCMMYSFSPQLAQLYFDVPWPTNFKYKLLRCSSQSSDESAQLLRCSRMAIPRTGSL